MVRQRYQLTPFGDIADYKILKSYWTRSTSDHIQLRVVVLDATIP